MYICTYGYVCSARTTRYNARERERETKSRFFCCPLCSAVRASETRCVIALPTPRRRRHHVLVGSGPRAVSLFLVSYTSAAPAVCAPAQCVCVCVCLAKLPLPYSVRVQLADRRSPVNFRSWLPDYFLFFFIKLLLSGVSQVS